MSRQQLILPAPESLAQVPPELFMPFREIAEAQGQSDNLNNTVNNRLEVTSFLFRNRDGQLHPNPKVNHYADPTTVVNAAEPFLKLAGDWLHSNGLVTVEYVNGNVLPGSALMPPPLWHVDDPGQDDTKIAFVANIDPTLVASGTLSGLDRNAYLEARTNAITDDVKQTRLRSIIRAAIEQSKLKVKAVGEHELIGMDNRHVHRPQINNRKTPVFREALRVYTHRFKNRSIDK